MAYPTVAAPYGLIPVNLTGGRVYAGAVRHIPIASGYDTGIFNGDVVKLITDGTVEKDTGTTAATPVGIFLGCEFTDSARGFVHSNQWPADQVAADAVALVCDDPDVLMKVALVSGTTVIAGAARSALIGGNGTLVQNAGVTANGKSQVAVLNSSGTTATLPVRFIDLVEETTDSSGNYTEAIIRWNVGHQYNNTTGLA